jgi:hypothetical protein
MEQARANTTVCCAADERTSNRFVRAAETRSETLQNRFDPSTASRGSSACAEDDTGAEDDAGAEYDTGAGNDTGAEDDTGGDPGMTREEFRG